MRRSGGWVWKPTPEGERLLGTDHGKYRPEVDCAMVTKISGKRCVKGWMHRLGHSTVETVDEGYGGAVSRG